MRFDERIRNKIDLEFDVLFLLSFFKLGFLYLF